LDPEFERELEEVSPDFARGAIRALHGMHFSDCRHAKGPGPGGEHSKSDERSRRASWIVYPKGRKELSENDCSGDGAKSRIKRRKSGWIFADTHCVEVCHSCGQAMNERSLLKIEFARCILV